jgi:hypothetical protein
MCLAFKFMRPGLADNAEIDLESEASTQKATKPPLYEADNDLESKVSTNIKLKPPLECKPGKVVALTKFFGQNDFWKKKTAKQGLDDFQTELEAIPVGHDLVDQSDSHSFSSTIKTFGTDMGNNSNMNSKQERGIATDASHPLVVSTTLAQNLPGSYRINSVSCTKMVMADIRRVFSSSRTKRLIFRARLFYVVRLPFKMVLAQVWMPGKLV